MAEEEAKIQMTELFLPFEWIEKMAEEVLKFIIDFEVVQWERRN